MKNYIGLLTVLLVLISSCAKEKKSVACSGSGGTYVGNVNLLNQNQVDSFGGFEYEKIIGVLYVSGSTVANLDALCSLRFIEGGMRIHSSPLSSLNGLHNLEWIISDSSTDSINTPYFGFDNLTNLINLNELQGLHTVQTHTFSVSDNPLLTNIDGLINSSISVNVAYVRNNSNLISIYGLENDLVRKWLSIRDCPNLSITASINLPSTISEVRVENTNLSSSGFQFLNVIDTVTFDLWIQNNPSLTHLNFLGNLNYINHGVFSENNSLDDLCGLQGCLPNSDILQVTIINNLYNPTPTDIINGDCTP